MNHARFYSLHRKRLFLSDQEQNSRIHNFKVKKYDYTYAKIIVKFKDCYKS